MYINKEDIYKGRATLLGADVIVTKGTSLFDRLTQIFTFSKWNHAALVLNDYGDIAELTAFGIKRHNLFARYHKKDFYIIRLDLLKEDRIQAIQYALTMLKRHSRYGFLTIISIMFKIIFKSHLVVKINGTLICSEFVAKALEHAGVIWSKDTSLITPADLFNFFVKKDGTK